MSTAVDWLATRADSNLIAPSPHAFDFFHACQEETPGSLCLEAALEPVRIADEVVTMVHTRKASIDVKPLLRELVGLLGLGSLALLR